MPAANIVLQNARSIFFLLHESARMLAMTGSGRQQNSTPPVSQLVVANAHTNGDEEPLFFGAGPVLFSPNRLTTWACTFSLWRLCRRSDCYFCQGVPRHVWELGLNPFATWKPQVSEMRNRMKSMYVFAQVQSGFCARSSPHPQWLEAM